MLQICTLQDIRAELISKFQELVKTIKVDYEQATTN